MYVNMCALKIARNSVFQSVCYLSTHSKMAQCHFSTALWHGDGRPTARVGVWLEKGREQRGRLSFPSHVEWELTSLLPMLSGA